MTSDHERSGGGQRSRERDEDSRPSRRGVIGAVAAGVTGAAIGVGGTGAATATAAEPGSTWAAPGGVFPAGVQSGDPTDSAVILTTQIMPPPGGAAVPVEWQVAADPTFTAGVRSGSTVADSFNGHSAKIDVPGLDAGRHYYYRFVAGGAFSPIGRTKTAPDPGTTPDSLRIAFGSCQDYTAGYYTAHRAIAQEDVDLVLWLGDYMYETGGTDFRTDTVGTSATLEAYRAKYRLYRSDQDLQAAHANHPWITVWDDHEVVNNYDRHVDPARRLAGYTAWFENHPTRPSPDEEFRSYRSFRWGGLADVFMLDTRQYRDPEVPMGSTLTLPAKAMTYQDRTILGAEQRQWLKDGLVGSEAAWRVIGNQVVMMPWRIFDFDEPHFRQLQPNIPENAGFYLNGDAWDGYQAERRELLTFLADNGVEDVAILTGDVHTFWAGKVRPNFDSVASPVVAYEFVGGSITSAFVDVVPGLSEQLQPLFRQFLKEIDFIDLTHKGYGLIELTPEELTCDLKFVDHRNHAATPVIGARFRARAGSRTLERLQ